MTTTMAPNETLDRRLAARVGSIVIARHGKPHADRSVRIDHHGWQIVAVLAALNGLAARSEKTGGRLAGIAMVLLLAVLAGCGDREKGQLPEVSGEAIQANYKVTNRSPYPTKGQAVFNVTPMEAAVYFNKIECFCFSQQTLGPGEAREMPLAFIVKSGVDRDITHITLSYAFFGIDGQRQTLTTDREAR